MLWNSVKEAAKWLTEYTGEKWSSNRVLNRWVELQPETVTVVINNQNELLKLEGAEWIKISQHLPNKSIALQVTAPADQFLMEILKLRKTVPLGLVDGLGQRYRIKAAITKDSLRLTCDEVEALIKLPSAFAKLVNELRIDPNKYDTTAELNEKAPHSADAINGFVEVTYKQPDDKPWLIANPKDPAPEQSWYIAARYFARMIVTSDPSLLAKRDILASKVSEYMKNAGIHKRGEKKYHAPSTIKKALVNITLN